MTWEYTHEIEAMGMSPKGYITQYYKLISIPVESLSEDKY
jgi:hypothetical protein